jgi:hypothetical protein
MKIKAAVAWSKDAAPPRLDPLLVELDYNKRMAGHRAVDRWTVERGFPLQRVFTTATSSARLAGVRAGV